MFKHFSTALAAACTWCAVTANAQDKNVSMFLEPDANGTVYFTASLERLQDYDPKPVLDGKGAGQGWQFVHYPGKYVGYVAMSDLDPGPEVRDGTKAFLRPDTDSPVLAVILEGEEAEVVRERGGWATVYFQGEAPAYFRPDLTAEALPPAPVAAPPPAETPPPADAPVVDDTPVLEEVVMQESVVPAPQSKVPGIPGPGLPRYLQGTFKPVTVWDRLFGSDYQYRIVDADDDTLAYVVIDNALLFGPVEGYWDQRVEIQGQIRRISGSVPFEIKARNLRVLR